MKVAELRKWIGKRIEWDEKPDSAGWYRTRNGILDDVKGRNVMVNDNWQWLPDMRKLRLHPSEKGDKS